MKDLLARWKAPNGSVAEWWGLFKKDITTDGFLVDRIGPIARVLPESARRRVRPTVTSGAPDEATAAAHATLREWMGLGGSGGGGGEEEEEEEEVPDFEVQVAGRAGIA